MSLAQRHSRLRGNDTGDGQDRSYLLAVPTHPKITVDDGVAGLLIFPTEARRGQSFFLELSRNAILFENGLVNIAVLVVGIAMDVIELQRLLRKPVVAFHRSFFRE